MLQGIDCGKITKRASRCKLFADFVRHYLFETFHISQLVYLGMSFLAPDVSKLRSLPGGFQHFCFPAGKAVVPDLYMSQRYVAGHLSGLPHLYAALTAPDCPLGRMLTTGLDVIAEFAFAADIVRNHECPERSSRTF